MEKFTEFVTGGGADPAKPAPKDPGGRGGQRGFGMFGSNFHVVVTGGSNNNYWSMGGILPAQSVQIDK